MRRPTAYTSNFRSYPRFIFRVSSSRFRQWSASSSIRCVLFIILMLLNLGFGYWPTWRMVLMPLLLVYITLPALGVGLAVSSISVKYRDFRPLLTIALQAGFYATPIFYPAELVPPRILPFYELNPMYWGVAFSRWIMLGRPLAVTPSLYFSIALSAAVIVFGYYAFAIYERDVVDAQ